MIDSMSDVGPEEDTSTEMTDQQKLAHNTQILQSLSEQELIEIIGDCSRGYGIAMGDKSPSNFDKNELVQACLLILG